MQTSPKVTKVTILFVLLILSVVGLLLLAGLPRFATLVEPLKAAINRRVVREPLQISQIVVNPEDPQVVYASSHFYGMWKSMDGGKTWRLAIQGLGTTDVYGLAIHPTKPQTLFAATTGGGIYRSMDAGSTWLEVSEGLTDTHVEDLAFDPDDPNTVYAATLREVFKSTDGGETWQPVFKENRKVGELFYVHTLLVIRSDTSKERILFVGTPGGGYRRAEGEEDWEPLEKRVGGGKLTSFAYDPRIKTLYAGTIAQKSFYKSTDGGKTWVLLGKPSAMWIHRIVLDPTHPDVIYIGSRGNGVYKTQDGGKTWMESNSGLTHNIIKGLAIDPKDQNRLYLGTPSMISISTHGGASWTPVEMKLPSYQTVVNALTLHPKAPKGTPSPPPAWKEKCNECHGWTDPILNYYSTSYWRVSPTNRDWRETMDRMAVKGSHPPTPEEKVAIHGYLNNYFGPKP